MQLVVVTGAGASKDLGIDGEPLPLMGDWSDRLCSALDAREQFLASACGLEVGLSGPEFEEALGTLLRWRDMLPLNERFKFLGGPNPKGEFGGAQETRTAQASRLHTVIEVLHESLYDEF